jgi:hypothetical protein
MGLFSKDKKNIDATTRQLLADKFGFHDFYWWPLNGAKPADTECFSDESFCIKLGRPLLVQTIKEMGENQLHKINEADEDEIIKTEDIESYNLIEVVYCNDNADWLIYFSHENTVTVSGKKLIDALKKNWADFDSLKETIYDS